MSGQEYVLMDHDSNMDFETSFEEFVDRLRHWMGPGRWVNVQLSTGEPKPAANLSLIMKRS